MSKAKTAAEPKLFFWVITDKPTDFPDSFVLCRWRVVDGEGVADKLRRPFKTLMQARDAIPGNAVPMPLTKDDDPVIAEWWM